MQVSGTLVLLPLIYKCRALGCVYLLAPWDINATVGKGALTELSSLLAGAAFKRLVSVMQKEWYPLLAMERVPVSICSVIAANSGCNPHLYKASAVAVVLPSTIGLCYLCQNAALCNSDTSLKGGCCIAAPKSIEHSGCSLLHTFPSLSFGVAMTTSGPLEGLSCETQQVDSSLSAARLCARMTGSSVQATTHPSQQILHPPPQALQVTAPRREHQVWLILARG